MPESSTAILTPRPVLFRRKERASSSVGQVFTHSTISTPHAFKRLNNSTIRSAAHCLHFLRQPAYPRRIFLKEIEQLRALGFRKLALCKCAQLYLHVLREILQVLALRPRR